MDEETGKEKTKILIAWITVLVLQKVGDTYREILRSYNTCWQSMNPYVDYRNITGKQAD